MKDFPTVLIQGGLRVFSRRTVLIQGAFEILNVGHVRVFEFAKKQGEYLIVALNTNELIAEYKKREAVQPWADKAEIISSFRCVDLVVPAPEFSPLKLLIEYRIDVYVVADEWVSSKSEEIAYMQRTGGRYVVAPRFMDLSTTEIKQRLLAEAEHEREQRQRLGQVRNPAPDASQPLFPPPGTAWSIPAVSK